MKYGWFCTEKYSFSYSIKMTFSWFIGWNNFIILIFKYSNFFRLIYRQKQLKFQNWWIKKLFHPLNHEKVIFTKISFSDCMYSLIWFWSIVVLLNGIKSELECESQSLGGQKVNFKYWGEKSIFHWKMEHFSRLKI